MINPDGPLRICSFTRFRELLSFSGYVLIFRKCFAPMIMALLSATTSEHKPVIRRQYAFGVPSIGNGLIAAAGIHIVAAQDDNLADVGISSTNGTSP